MGLSQFKKHAQNTGYRGRGRTLERQEGTPLIFPFPNAAIIYGYLMHL